MINKAKFIAEVSSNHHQEIKRCLAFIDAAKEIGCSAVKFQLFKVDELFAPEILRKSKTHSDRRRWELPVDYLPQIADHCKKVGVEFGCTPFYLNAVDELFSYVDFYKIASYELLWKDLLLACAQTGKPVILSTGMATMDEVQYAVEVLDNAGCVDLTILHCVSSYPARREECNLGAIEILRGALGKRVGWSDHSMDPAVIYRAVHRFQSEVVEFHMDLEGEGAEYSFGHCWLPNQISTVIETVNNGMLADGIYEKRPMTSELPDRDWRADPSDGLRPLRETRNSWKG